MFFGYSFAMDSSSFAYQGDSGVTINDTKFTDMIVDEIYATNDSSLVLPDNNDKPVQYSIDNYTIPYDSYWDKYTALHSAFNGNAFGGNIKFDYNTIQAIKLKRRKKGELQWQTIYYKVVNPKDESPFNIVFSDFMEPSNTDIEYTYTFVINNMDYDANISSVHSEFDGYFIVEGNIVNGEVQNTVYKAIAETNNVPTYNRASQNIVSPGSKYPYVINNGKARYYSATFSANFFPILNCCEIDGDNAWSYRNSLDSFLTNGKSKILKKFDGDEWMINTSGNISRSDGGHYQVVTSSFDWVECGNCWDIGDLYDNEFVMTDIDRRS